MPSLATRAIEDSRADRELKHVEQSRDLGSVAREVEDRLELSQVLGVEVRRPPILNRHLEWTTGTKRIRAPGTLRTPPRARLESRRACSTPEPPRECAASCSPCPSRLSGDHRAPPCTARCRASKRKYWAFRYMLMAKSGAALRSISRPAVSSPWRPWVHETSPNSSANMSAHR